MFGFALKLRDNPNDWECHQVKKTPDSGVLFTVFYGVVFCSVLQLSLSCRWALTYRLLDFLVFLQAVQLSQSVSSLTILEPQ